MWDIYKSVSYCFSYVLGQEDETVLFSGDTKITPFNMREEMDEGHFDSEGNFIFDKNDENVKDAWLEGIDWEKVNLDIIFFISIWIFCLSMNKLPVF